MSVYMIVDIRVGNDEDYARYRELAEPIVRRHNGKYLVRGGEVLGSTNGWEPERIVVIEFPSIEEYRRCFGSEEYRAIAYLRERSATSRMVIVEGTQSA